jgi:hypothetical protein
MVEFSGEESRPFILEASKGSMNQDLTETTFVETYFASKFKHFWVAVNTNNEIVGKP